jgi:serine/threonine protein kinase
LRRFESGQQQFSDFAVPLIAGLAAFLLIAGVASYLIMLRENTSRNTRKPIDISKDQYSTQSSTVTASTTIGTFVTKTTGIAKPAYLETDTREFRLLKQIAQGGGGTVYVGEFLTESKVSRFAKTIIVKKVGESYESLTKRLRDNFDQEISLMEFFRNEKHIAKLYGYCHVPCCIIMKYYPKKSLDAFIEANKYPLWMGLSFAMDISRGLKTMHSKSVAHNDLKPQNILLDTESSGRLFCVLTDFGISHILEEKVIAAKAFSVVNLRGISARYASPEAYQRFRKLAVSPSNVLKAGDIYCFAGILYDLLTRKSPWDRL